VIEGSESIWKFDLMEQTPTYAGLLDHRPDRVSNMTSSYRMLKKKKLT